MGWEFLITSGSYSLVLALPKQNPSLHENASPIELFWSCSDTLAVVVWMSNPSRSIEHLVPAVDASVRGCRTFMKEGLPGGSRHYLRALKLTDGSGSHPHSADRSSCTYTRYHGLPTTMPFPPLYSAFPTAAPFLPCWTIYPLKAWP